MLSNKAVLQNIVMNANDGIVVTDTEGTVTACNNGILKLMDLNTSHQLVGQQASDIFCSSESNDKLNFQYFLDNHFGKVGEATLYTRENKPLVTELKITDLQLESENQKIYILYINDVSHHLNNKLVKQNEHRELNKLTANIPGVVFRCQYHRTRQLQFISPAVSTLTGWDADDFAQGNVTYTDLMHEVDEQRIWRSIGVAMREKQSYTIEYRLLHRSGKSIWVSENGRVVFDDDGLPTSIVGSISDNTELKARNAEFEGTVNALNRATAVIEFDLTGCVLKANEPFLKLMGYTEDEVIGHHHSIFCTVEQVKSAEYKQFWKKLRRGEFDNGEYVRLNKQGEEVWIQATYNPIFDADGKPYKVMKFATDLSQRQAMEEELRGAMGQAEAAVSARGAFLANMSHEIRTPMNAIIGFSEILLKTELDDTQQHHAKIVLNASRSLLRLLNEILDIAKLEEGAISLELRSFNFKDLCEQITASVKIHADKKQLAVELDFDENVPDYILGDSLRIQQILLNLLNNAIKFTEKGSVKLSAAYENDHLMFKVIDTGIGMDKSYLKTIFDPFTQSDASVTRKFGGTGLGTSICHQLVELMNGTIDVQSELGAGSTFTVTLPIPKANQQEIAELEAEQETSLPELKLLIAEDTEASRQLLEIILEEENHQLVITEDGEELVAAFKANAQNDDEQPFDMIITDLQMPNLDGFGACEQIRDYETSNKLSPVPIIALSANVLEEDRQRAKNIGMNGFSFKPLQPNKLFEEMARVLDLKQQNDNMEDNFSEPRSGYEEDKKAHEMIANAANINWIAGMRLWKKKSVFVKAINNFISNNFDDINQMSTALSNKEYEKIITIAHRLRGASGSLSLNKICKICEQLETLSFAKDALKINDLLQLLPAAFTNVEQEVSAETQKTGDNKKSKSSKPNHMSAEDHHLVIAALDDLKKSLTAHELNDSAMEKLRSLLSKKALRELSQSIEQFDFDAALAALEDIQEVNGEMDGYGIAENHR